MTRFMERNTTQRRAIRAALDGAGRPLSPNEALGIARKMVPGLGIATVYRNLNALVEEGSVVQVSLPDESPRYEMAGKEHHHHFRCRKCHGVFEVAGCGVKAKVPRGFRVERHEVVLYGVCSKCGK